MRSHLDDDARHDVVVQYGRGSSVCLECAELLDYVGVVRVTMAMHMVCVSHCLID